MDGGGGDGGGQRGDDERGEDEGERGGGGGADGSDVRIYTANGGLRRTHHRPWTLREVLTLVEGVARCGGGKWADIKKLAFASIGDRTAVDLKVRRGGRLPHMASFLSGDCPWRFASDAPEAISRRLYDVTHIM